MIINIDETKRIKRLVIEFGDSDPEEFDVSSNNSDEFDIPSFKSSNKQKTKKQKPKKDYDTTEHQNSRNSRDSQVLSTDYGSNSISKEVVEKPVIPDVEDREVEVAAEMQNLVF